MKKPMIVTLAVSSALVLSLSIFSGIQGVDIRWKEASASTGPSLSVMDEQAVGLKGFFHSPIWSADGTIIFVNSTD